MIYLEVSWKEIFPMWPVVDQTEAKNPGLLCGRPDTNACPILCCCFPEGEPGPALACMCQPPSVLSLASLMGDTVLLFSQVAPSGGLPRAQWWAADSCVQVRQGEWQWIRKGVKVMRMTQHPLLPLQATSCSHQYNECVLAYGNLGIIHWENDTLTSMNATVFLSFI